MDVSYGYEDSAKGGRYLPVNVTIQNNQETPVEGTLQIKTRESDETVYRYDYSVEVEAKGSCRLRAIIFRSARRRMSWCCLWWMIPAACF